MLNITSTKLLMAGRSTLETMYGMWPWRDETRSWWRNSLLLAIRKWFQLSRLERNKVLLQSFRIVVRGVLKTFHTMIQFPIVLDGMNL
uniref:Uncharacterized protein n=1 Tax=Nelumbo nucifera TaxID=4432 RepID=A0A822YXH8_NELNU|nr:TPA_asm: hypothetical protein HUJ06_006669 [Nelumbo nucifera]